MNDSHKRQLLAFYTACFLLSYGWLFYNGLLFHQLQPVFFTNRLDLSLDILLLTGIQEFVLQSQGFRWGMDMICLLLPLLVFLSRKRSFLGPISLLTLVFHFVYALLLSSFSHLSIAGFLGWILVPMLFIPSSIRGFYFSMHIVRIIFLVMFFTAGVWKIRTGGLFSTGQMSGVLLTQHAAYLVHAPGNWFSRTINYLVAHEYLSYSLYLLATVAELVFVIGFFTRKYDRWLIAIFLVFAILDLILMRIFYFHWLIFLGCFWFSRYEEPGDESIAG